MRNYIEHEKFIELYNKDQKIFNRLFEGNLINSLIRLMDKESTEWKKYGYTEDQGRDKMIGDLFEIFAEMFFKILGASNNIGVYNYKPENIDDYGVDGFGKGIDDKPCTIQVKFRSDLETQLTSDDLKQFAFQSIVKHDVDKDTTTNMIILTTAEGLHWITDSKVFLGRLRVIGRNQLRTLLDNNFPFWNCVRDYVKNTIEEYY
jgi:hypothetical protein